MIRVNTIIYLLAQIRPKLFTHIISRTSTRHSV